MSECRCKYRNDVAEGFHHTDCPEHPRYKIPKKEEVHNLTMPREVLDKLDTMITLLEEIRDGIGKS